MATAIKALPHGPSLLKLDSKSAIDMCFDPVAFKKTKHILRDAHFLRDVVSREVFKPTHVPSQEEWADVMSKAVSRPTFLSIRPHLVRIVGGVGVGGVCDEESVASPGDGVTCPDVPVEEGVSRPLGRDG
mgnify:CR=1 FL=1